MWDLNPRVEGAFEARVSIVGRYLLDSWGIIPLLHVVLTLPFDRSCFFSILTSHEYLNGIRFWYLVVLNLILLQLPWFRPAFSPSFNFVIPVWLAFWRTRSMSEVLVDQLVDIHWHVT